MKSKLFKKLIAGAATLAIAAQFAVVLPASAAEIYKQDYESVADVEALKGIWTMQDTSAAKLGNDQEHGNYASYDFSTISANSRGAETTFTANTSGKESYVVEFDAALTAGDNQATYFAVKTSDFKYISNNVNYGADTGYLLKMTTTASETWTLNDVSTSTAEIKAGEWHHYSLIVDTAKKLVSATITNSAGTAVLDKGILPINGNSVDIKGIYMLAGRYNAVMNVDNILVRDKDDSDEFGELADEDLSEITFETELNREISQPAEGSPVNIPITVKAKGVYGGDLTEADGIKYEWSTTGFSNEDGYISLSENPAEGTAPWTTGSSGEDIPTTANTVYFGVGHGVSNWYGSVNVKVTYKDAVRTLSTPVAVIGASDSGSNLAPKAGYPESMNSYDDALVDYKGTANGLTSGDVVLNQWSIYGSNGARTLQLKKDEDGTKFLQFHSNGGGGSTVGVYQLADQSEQYIVDMKVRFTGGSGSFGHYFNSSNNKDANQSWAVSYASNELTVGTQKISGLNNTDWFRIVTSADESIGTHWVKVYNNAGELVGEVDSEPLNTAFEVDNKGNKKSDTPAYKLGQKYFCVGGAFPIDLASFRVYKPTVSSIAITGQDTISVPSADDVAGKGLENSEVYVYDKDAKKLTITLPEAKADVTAAQFIVAQYDGRRLKSFVPYSLTFTDKKAEIADFTMPDSCKLMLWDSFEGMKPVIPAEGTGDNNPSYVPQKEEIDLNALAETAEGFKITGEVDWSIDTDDEKIELKKDGQTAKLIVAEGAPAGAVTVTARCGSAYAEKTVNLTTTGNSITARATASSLTIPFAGGEAVSTEVEAYTVNKDGNRNEFAFDDDGNATTTPAAIEYSILDKNLRDITESLPAGITIAENAGKITVTASDAAKPAIIYVRAKNNDQTPLTRDVKINIHGLSFAFGSDAPADDSLTQVTAESYTEKLGYGFADISNLTVEASDIKSTDNFQFKVKVPNGNYQVKLTGSGYVLSETVDGIAASTGITRIDGLTGMTKQTDRVFNTAVVDGVLDISFKNEYSYTVKENGQDVVKTVHPTPLIEKLEITQLAEKAPNTKPAVFAIGDSTTDNQGNSWGNAGGNVIGNYTNLGTFNNHGKAGDDSVVYYNAGRVENILLALCPGDIVTVNMGINSKATGEPQSYYTMVDKYYVEAIEQRGGIPVIVTATPQGPVGKGAGNYSNGVFTCNRGNDAHNGDLRNIAKTHDLDIIELGYWGDEYFNGLTADDAAAAGKETVLELVQSWYNDHNHYKEPLATTIANHILSIVNEIAAADYDGAHNWKHDTHISQD